MARSDWTTAFRSPALLVYLGGNLTSIVGTWGQRVVVFWLAWELTASTAVLGTLAALELLPAVLASPVAGAMADRSSAFRLARNVQAISVLPPLLMVFIALAGEVNLAVLMTLTLTTGILNGLDHPLRLLLVGSVVPREHISISVVANSITFNIGRMIGPVIGGIAVSENVPAVIFGYNALSFLIFAAAITWLAPRYRSGTKSDPRLSDGLSPKGWMSMFRTFDRTVVLMFALFGAVAGLIRPIFELLPRFAEEMAGNEDGAHVFALLTSAQGVGAIAGAFFTALLLARLNYRSVAAASGVSLATAAFFFLLSPNMFLSLTSLAFLAGATLSNAIATQVAIQTGTPETIRGRALSMYTMALRGLPAAGALIVGMIGEVLPIDIVFLVLAGIALAFSIWMATIGIRRKLGKA